MKFLPEMKWNKVMKWQNEWNPCLQWNETNDEISA